MEEKNYTAGELLDLITLAEKSVEHWKIKRETSVSECEHCLRNINVAKLKAEDYYEKAIDILLKS